jgi:hypothetical protein
MVNDPLSVDKAIEILNSIVEVDRSALSNLINQRVLCNEILAGHLTVQVSCVNGENKVGLLGILNGLFGTFDSGNKAGWGPITMNVEDDGVTIINFKKTENIGE